MTTIGDRAFWGTGLTSVYIPKNVTHLGEYSFATISTLTSVEIAEGVEALGFEYQGVIGNYKGSVFYGCSALVDVKLPSSLRHLGAQAFYGCSSLEKLELPDGLESIGNMSFSYCGNIKQLVIPDSVRIIGTNVFSGWSAEQTICFEVSYVKARLFSDVIVNIAANMVYDYVKPIQ